MKNKEVLGLLGEWVSLASSFPLTIKSVKDRRSSAVAGSERLKYSRHVFSRVSKKLKLSE
jgi:hypothetical protein